MKTAQEITEPQKNLVSLYVDAAFPELFFLNVDIAELNEQGITEIDLNDFRNRLLDVETWLDNDDQVKHFDEFKEKLFNHPSFTATEIILAVGYNQGF